MNNPAAYAQSNAKYAQSNTNFPEAAVTIRDVLRQVHDEPPTPAEPPVTRAMARDGASGSTSDGAKRTSLEAIITAWSQDYAATAIERASNARACENNGVFRVPATVFLQAQFDAALHRLFAGNKSPFALDEVARAALALRAVGSV